VSELPTADEIARAMAATPSLEELDAYAEQAVLRGLAPGESAAIAARRFDLMALNKRKG
jgi:hypothetical protein